jgi:hypothetical protein
MRRNMNTHASQTRTVRSLRSYNLERSTASLGVELHNLVQAHHAEEGLRVHTASGLEVGASLLERLHRVADAMVCGDAGHKGEDWQM